MSLYYLLLAMTRFHSDPRVGTTLFDAGVVLVTPVKVVGLFTVVAAVFLPSPPAAARRLKSPQAGLFLIFVTLPVLGTLTRGLPVPSGSISSLISFLFLMIATRLLVRTEERMLKAVRVMILASALASLWIYKQQFLQHLDRPGGVEQDPNYEALTLVAVIPLAVWLARRDAGRWWRRLGLASVLVMTFGVVLTESRAGLIALGVLCLALLVYSQRKMLTMALLAAAAVLMLVFAPRGLGSRFERIRITGVPTNGDESSALLHFELLIAGLNMIGAHPLVGIGLDRFKAVATDYNPRLLQMEDTDLVAHNTYVQLAAEGGLPTLAMSLALIGLAFVNCRSVQRTSDVTLGDLAVAMRLSLLAYSVAAASVTAQYGVVFWFIIFSSQNLREIATDQRQRESDVRVLGPIQVAKPKNSTRLAYEMA